MKGFEAFINNYEVDIMLVSMLKSKLHRAKVTDTKLHYAGSIAIDPDLMEAVGMLPYEAVEIANVTNGNRFKTYAVKAERGTKDVIVMGAAAHLAKKDDVIIIFSFGDVDLEEAKTHKPAVVALDEENNIIKKIC